MARPRFRRLMIAACVGLSLVPACDEEPRAQAFLDFGAARAGGAEEEVIDLPGSAATAESDRSILYAQPSCE